VISSYVELNRFLMSRIRALEECVSQSSAKVAKSSTSRVHVATASTKNSPVCPLCQARHYMSSCSKFTDQSPIQRREFVKKFKRCFNCLSSSHSASQCATKYSCRLCSKRHHTTLHLDSDSDFNATKSTHTTSVSDPPSEEVEVTSLFASATLRPRSQILLATAQVRIESTSGHSVVVRALLD